MEVGLVFLFFNSLEMPSTCDSWIDPRSTRTNSIAGKYKCVLIVLFHFNRFNSPQFVGDEYGYFLYEGEGLSTKF